MINNTNDYNKLCNLLAIKYPIIQAGMSGASTPELVAAVSNAGGLGLLGATSLSLEDLSQNIKKIKCLTNRPFGINLLLAGPETDSADQLNIQHFLDTFRKELDIELKEESINKKIVLPKLSLSEKIKIIVEEEKVPLLSFGLGDPRPLVKQIHDANDTKIMAMVTTVEEAIQVVENGADIVMAQGAEAGGHRSTFKINSNSELPLIGTMALVPQIVDALHKDSKNEKEIPAVVAAGGIVDGRGLIAALSLGASGVSIGTRFLLAKENSTFQAYKERLLASKETDTIVTKIFSGRPARGIKNKLVERFINSEINPLPWPLQWFAAEDIYQSSLNNNNADYYPLLAGQGLRILESIQSASEIVEEIVNEANDVLNNLNNQFNNTFH
ncbi:MAG TPA: nitronate monooxygenase [Nitrososphaeraceae archaeon]|nr:nitronate monooxygenase [Nitrososphaeraceae archaeon]